jgi:hypothetical protein
MRRFLLAALSAASVLASIGPATATQDRYCLQGRKWGYPGNCQFSSYGQCMATASGTDAYCGINPADGFVRRQHGRHYGGY